MKTFERFFTEHKDKMKLLGISLNPPATPEDINKLEIAVGQKLPTEIRDFYAYCDGFDTQDWMFNILSIEQILYYKFELEKLEFYFAEYMIYSDNWRIKLENSTTFSIINGNHNEETQLVLANSIYEFLSMYLNSDGVLANNGLYHWYEEKKESMIRLKA